MLVVFLFFTGKMKKKTLRAVGVFWFEIRQVYVKMVQKLKFGKGIKPLKKNVKRDEHV